MNNSQNAPKILLNVINVTIVLILFTYISQFSLFNLQLNTLTALEIIYEVFYSKFFLA